MIVNRFQRSKCIVEASLLESEVGLEFGIQGVRRLELCCERSAFVVLGLVDFGGLDKVGEKRIDFGGEVFALS